MDFDEIFEEYFDRIYYKVLGVVKNPEDAEDISQEVFMSVYRNLKSFRSESNIYTWIYKIAINKIYDFFRKRKVELDINEEILMLEDNTNIETPIFLEEKLKLISPKEREIVILNGYKLKEIAEMKNINISTIKSIYYKAIKDMGGN